MLRDRKYIPVNAKTLQGDCTTAFVDVFASSMDEPDAFVCCGNSHGTFYPPTTNTSLLCTPPVSDTVWISIYQQFSCEPSV